MATLTRPVIIGVVVGVVVLVALIVGLVIGLRDDSGGKGLTALPASSIIIDKNTDLSAYTEPLNKLHEEYTKKLNDYAGNLVTCSPEGTKLDPGKSCKFEMSWMPDCKKEDDWGYKKNSTTTVPCVILQPNKIEDWKPQVYTSFEELPDNMPEKLKDKIQEKWHGKAQKEKMLWVWCEGETDKDTENMGGEVKMAPYPGFPVDFFPYNTSPHYMQPLVSLDFGNINRGVEVNIKCRFWAKDVDADENPVHLTIKMG